MQQETARTRDSVHGRRNRTVLHALGTIVFSGIALAGFSSGASAISLFTQVVTDPRPFSPMPIGAIPGLAGHEIHILKLGIGGDAGASSGPVVFGLEGGGIDIIWAAGQPISIPYTPDYVLDPTPIVDPSTGGLGFSYFDVDLSATIGESLAVSWLWQADFDFGHTYGTDILGNFYNDPLRSARAWALYEYVSAQQVPEPAALMLFSTGLFGFGLITTLRHKGTS